MSCSTIFNDVDDGKFIWIEDVDFEVIFPWMTILCLVRFVLFYDLFAGNIRCLSQQFLNLFIIAQPVAEVSQNSGSVRALTAVGKLVIDPQAVLLESYQPGVFKNLQMFGNGRLGNAQKGLDFTDAQDAGLQNFQQLHSVWVGNGLHDFDKILH